MQKLRKGRIQRLTDSKDCDYCIVTDADDIFPKMMDQAWQTILFNEAKQLMSTATSKEGFIHDLCSQGITDFHWNWEGIVSDSDVNDYQQRTFYFIVNDQPEGVLHALFPKQSRLNHGDNLVYVDRIAVAPWNRPQANPQRFKGIGSILMLFIESFSEQEGYEGAVGLHALEQAKSFYVYLGMKSLGIDQSYEGLEYFEKPKSPRDKNTSEEAA
ncbi:GNAT family N-acetyltransferase [Photobacterium sp. 2_MG-2023]|uniref:GNAT family N-acetyltransferase n=1 Tax=Photobacterium sp. 2_MG-2023 TaxID=3062663 RepID=UPI0026E1BDE3|nr:GNAT family N-acetyltransferase [Photobacterium sp. 2_MG-2023]MDO6582647.1 GNAT family N-acetyltransferase [Photobacterium sp. 2_MG-2023]